MILPREKSSSLLQMLQAFQHPASAPSTWTLPQFISQCFHYYPPLLLPPQPLQQRAKVQAVNCRQGGFSREPLISSTQTDLADCRMEVVIHNKTFILKRGAPLPVLCPSQTQHPPTETTAPRGRSLDNPIGWW